MKMSICPNSTVDVEENNPMYTRDFQTMLDEEGCVEEYSGHVSDKKRRLSLHQVKALEKNFEVENKLEPERKVKLAGELGLQPRQVAVWFQNRRARWKTKQLERDYGLLKADRDALKHKYEKLRQDNESLMNEIKELKMKLNEDGKPDTKVSVKDENLVVSETEEKSKLETEYDSEAAMEVNFESFNGDENEEIGCASFFCDLKDGSSDSDSSAILNDYNSPRHQFLDIHSGGSSSSMNTMSFQFSDSGNKEISASILGDGQKMCQLAQMQFVKIEEHDFFGDEESDNCSNLFCDDQAPTLHWYSSHDWN
ncbi:hypothetical protein ABFS82_08G223200 [Erythranthe guttata]|nr:PREDICTED: homeobox-leucine zipper protein ATHB-6-like isoform X1 [Erythranthe guttata]|eukprot:XP_012845132.1 PREDICTED: homeobox-leucine zipper protein ATHB-6-like isoform X1 [Erythranthe guttata]